MSTLARNTRTNSWTRDRINLSAPFANYGGNLWVAEMPTALNFRADTSDEPYVSRLALLEDGKISGDGHANHERIKNEGRGLYSHWHNVIYFSPTDNSDPNINGRGYSVALAPLVDYDDLCKVLPLGGCQLNDPIYDLHKRSLINCVTPFLDFIPSLSPSEHLQIMEFYRGNLAVHSSLRRRLMFNDSFQPTTCSGLAVDTADIILAEVTSFVEMEFEGYYLNRNVLLNVFVLNMHRFGKEACAMAMHWFQNGLEKADEEVRRTLTPKLLEFFPGGSEEAELDRKIISDIRPIKLDVSSLRKRIETLRGSISGQLAIMTAILRYTPDGRPIGWPPGYLKVLNELCRELDIPIINPCRLVMRDGVEASLTEDMIHYRREFVRVVADDLLPFIECVRWRHGSGPPEIATSFPFAAY